MIRSRYYTIPRDSACGAAPDRAGRRSGDERLADDRARRSGPCENEKKRGDMTLYIGRTTDNAMGVRRRAGPRRQEVATSA